MNSLAFVVLPVLPVHLTQPEAQNGHAHAEKKRQKPDDDISESAAAIHAGRRFKAGVVAGPDACGNAGHGEGRANEQHKTRATAEAMVILLRRSRFPRFNFGDAALCLRDPLLMTPHL